MADAKSTAAKAKVKTAAKAGTKDKTSTDAKTDAKTEAKDATTADADSGEKTESSTSDAPTGYSRGENQKVVTDAFRENWDVIFGKKPRGKSKK